MRLVSKNLSRLRRSPPAYGGPPFDALRDDFLQDTAQLLVERNSLDGRMGKAREVQHGLQQLIHALDVVADRFLETDTEGRIVKPVSQELSEGFDGNHRILQLMGQLVD